VFHLLTCSADPAQQSRKADQAQGLPNVISGPPQNFWGTTEANAVTTTTPRSKRKSRPEFRPTGLDESGEDDIPEQQTVTSVAVNANSLSVFHCMFPATPRKAGLSLRWDAFVAALLDAGCSAQQHSGSAVNFKRAEGSCVVHRPHPDPVVNPIMLGSTAKRFAKHFGWSNDTFIERERARA